MKLHMMNEDFGNYLTDILNKSSLALMLSIGHRTGLFDTMSTLQSPSTTHEIAQKANLNERYVREWLGAMVTGRIIIYDSKNNKFSLSDQNAQHLTRNSKDYNFAASMQWIPILSQVEDHIIKCFKEGGGIPYSFYGRFHEVMAEESYQTVAVALLDHILPLVPDINNRLKSGIKVLDAGCGMGRAVNLLASSFPASTFYGFDVSNEAIAGAIKGSINKGNSNTIFESRDISGKPFEEKFDLVTAFDAIHDQPKPDRVLKNIHDCLNEDGIFLMQDILASSRLENNIQHPIGPFLYTISCLHCMSVSLSQNGAGLGAVWGKEKAVEMLEEAGFSKVDVKTLPHDFQNYYYICYKDRADQRN